MTIPRLRALHRQWLQHPPVHLLVAAYLGYEAPEIEDEVDEEPVDQVTTASRTPWMQGMGSIPASDELRGSTTPLAGLAALERMFFGEVKE